LLFEDVANAIQGFGCQHLLGCNKYTLWRFHNRNQIPTLQSELFADLGRDGDLSFVLNPD
jgi:hypothetical protein